MQGDMSVEEGWIYDHARDLRAPEQIYDHAQLFKSARTDL